MNKLKILVLCLGVFSIMMFSCSIPGSEPANGSATEKADVAVSDGNSPLKNDTFTDPDLAQYLVPAPTLVFEFTQAGAYTWRNPYYNATATVTLVGGGGGGGGSGSYKFPDIDPNDFGSGGGGGGAGEILVTNNVSLDHGAEYSGIVGHGGRRGGRGNYQETGKSGYAGEATTFASLTARSGSGGAGGSHNHDRVASGGAGFPAGDINGGYHHIEGGAGGDNGRGHGTGAGNYSYSGVNGGSAPNNSGGGGGGASGSQGGERAANGGYGGSGYVKIVLTGYQKVYRIRNRWSGEYLYEKYDAVTSQWQGVASGYVPSSNNASWWIEETVPGTTAIRLKNRVSNHYMNIENVLLTYVDATDAPEGWFSSQWFVDDIDGFKRFRNRWNGKIIHVEDQTGMSEIDYMSGGYLSSHWVLEPTTVVCNLYKIKNHATGKYLTDAVGSSDATTTSSAGSSATQYWFLAQKEGYRVLVNVGSGDFINIETRDTYVRSTHVPHNFWSAQWTPVDSSGYIRFRCRWTGEYLYDANTVRTRYSASPPTLVSSEWELQVIQ